MFEMHYQNVTEPFFSSRWLNNISKGNALFVGLFVCTFNLISCWKLYLNMVYKSGHKANFSKEEKLLMGALGRVFPEAKNKDKTIKGCKNSTLKVKTVSNGK